MATADLEQSFRRVLDTFQDAYPQQLVTGFPRVAAQLVDFWGSEQFDGYLQSLLIDDRGDRQGFPPTVAEELLVLMRVADKQRHIVPDPTPDIWGHDDAHIAFRPAEQKYTPAMLLEAAIRGEHEQVAQMLKHQVSCGRTDEAGKTPLMWAASYGHHQVVTLLLDAGAQIDVSDQGGYQALHGACAAGHLPVVEVLLARGAPINVQNRRGDTPLMLAAHALRTPLVRHLLAAGADPLLVDEVGNTALHQALLYGRGAELTTVLRLLPRNSLPNRHGDTPAALALLHADLAVRALFA
ncbi:ankyrin repeat domain-containing protein [Chitinibacteraceae bacterium HSL-7]